MYNTALHQQLSQGRRSRGLTQSELAERVGCKQSAVSMMERGSASALSWATLEAIAKELDIDISAFAIAAPETATGPQTQGSIYCPIFDCPANMPYSVNGKLYALPRKPEGQASHCRYCGELMESVCPGCGENVAPGSACCHACGTPYIATPEAISEGTEAWAQAQRSRLQELGI